MKLLPMFLDGTWNKPDDNTNVWRVSQLVSDTDAVGNVQKAYYHTGVGTKPFERIRGGAFGEGLNANIQHAYQWLMSNYEDMDKIYLFGFSRGAYTARSLAGLIGKCGLLLPGSIFSVPQTFERYKQGKDVPALYELVSPRYEGPRTDEDKLLIQESRLVDIEFIGVWDTVGALGVPGLLGRFWRKSYYFHSTNPSVRYKHMYQALAIDENRADYQAALWTLFRPKDGPVPTLRAGQTLEQRWFIGAHCNVGGGYRNDALAQIPLAWMLDKAIAAGLKFRRPLTLTRDEYKTAPVDSFARFLGGLYRVFKLNRRHFRTIGRDPVATKTGDGMSYSLNERIDASVFERVNNVAGYRPKNLVEWANRRGKHLDTLSGDQAA
jgi:uncharacterized protein (DUF2235 family)